mgnify:CR=1 FL=1
MFEEEIEQDIESFQWRWHSFPASTNGSPAGSIPVFLINQHRVDERVDMLAYAARVAALGPFKFPAAAGMDGHLCKPLDPGLLYRTLLQYLQPGGNRVGPQHPVETSLPVGAKSAYYRSEFGSFSDLQAFLGNGWGQRDSNNRDRGYRAGFGPIVLVATGEPARFANYNADTRCHYEVYSYRPDSERRHTSTDRLRP